MKPPDDSLPDLTLLAEQCDLLGLAAEERDRMCELAKDPGQAKLERGRDDSSLITLGGKALHSRHAPGKEAQRQCAEILERLENRRQLLVLFGAGIGLLIAELLERCENPLLWLEPRRDVAALALACTDLRGHLKQAADARDGPRVQLIVEAPEEDAFHAIFAGRGNEDVIFAVHRGSFQADPVYPALRGRIESFLNRKAVNLATMARFDRLWARNLLRNFRSFVQARPLARLADSARDRTAIVLSAGPSLYADLEKLKSLGDPRERFVLIAVDTALGVLASADLRPHFAVSVDAQAVNRYYFELPAGFLEETYIVFDPTACYMSLRLAPAERVFYFASPFSLARVFLDCLDESAGELASGGSVSTNAYDLATRLGCRRILLAGQDLGFSGGLAHSPGAILEERLNFREERLFRRELHNYRQLSALPVRWLPAENGAFVPANDKLVIFRQWLESRFARDAARGLEIRNLSRAGVRLEHAPRLSDVELRRIWEETTPKSYAPPPEALRAPPLNAEALQRRVAELARSFLDFTETLKEGEDLADQLLLAARKRSDRFAKLLREMEAMDERVLEQSELSRMAGGAMQRVIFRITENFAGSSAAQADPALAAAEKTQALYAGLREAAELHARWFARSARELQYAAEQERRPLS